MSIEKEIKEKEETINAVLLAAAQSEEKHKKVLDILSKKPESTSSVTEAFQKIRDIYNDLNNKCAEYNLPSGKLFNNFDGLLDKIEEAINFPLFYHKNIIALCGQFSSGKTSMINSFLEENILPTDVIRTTAINTFVICDKDYENQGLDIINCFSGKTEKVDKELYKFITHAFAEKYNKDIHNMVKYVLLHTRKLKYENIALLDTPGYTGDENDENIAMKGIAKADNIIWVIDIENGTIKNNDLKFLEKDELNGKDILIVLNKADTPHEEKIDKIVEEIKNQLEARGIDYKDIVVYSSRLPEKYKEGKKKLFDFFESENNSIERNYLKDINIIFEEFIEYYKKLYEDFSNNTKALNIAKAQSINSKTKADVKSIDITLNKIKKDRENIEKLIEKLKIDNKKCLDLLGDSLYHNNREEYERHKKYCQKIEIPKTQFNQETKNQDKTDEKVELNGIFGKTAKFFGGIFGRDWLQDKNTSALIDEIKDVVAAQLNISDKSKISDTAYFVDDLNADSLDLVELIMELEKRYDIKIPQEDQEKIQSILDAAIYIEEHMRRLK